jgi:GNAT superfamily N-acetyltransferase
MPVSIQPFAQQHLEQTIALALAAWSVVFPEMEKAYLPEVYQAFYPNGWQERQRTDVESACTSPDYETWVACDDGTVIGFASIRLHAEDSMGEVHMIAVAPNRQGEGIGKLLMEHCLTVMRGAGMTIAMVETGGDPGHAPARHTYEATGFTKLPVARFFRAL